MEGRVHRVSWVAIGDGLSGLRVRPGGESHAPGGEVDSTKVWVQEHARVRVGVDDRAVHGIRRC